jgi:AbrB family looped-hinge helix DNA binding protein
METREYDKDITTISSRGQLVIPKKFRQCLKIKSGDTLGLIRIDDLLVIKKIGFEDEKVGKKLAAARKDNGFTFEELLYPEKK